MNDNRWNYDYSTHYRDAQNSNINANGTLPTMQTDAQYTATPPNGAAQAIKPPKKRTGLKIIAIILVIALCGAAGFGGGYIGGAMSSGSAGITINQTTGDSNGSTTLSTSDGSLMVSDVAKIAAPSVVEVMTEQVTTNSMFGQYVVSGAGSGVIISEDGYIITNAHVVDGAQQITITTSDKQEYKAEIVGSDVKTDIAILKVDATGLTAATMGNSDELSVGDFALAVGNPLGTLGGTVTDGIISALDREIIIDGQSMTMLQTNAAVSPGNSGGGLYNSSGELIGIVTAKSGDDETEGLGFAIPINIVLEISSELINNGYVTGRPALGISVVSISDVESAYSSGVTRLGVYIADITPGGGAEKAGLQVMDYIVSINGIAVETTTDLIDEIETMSVGDSAQLQVIREGEIVTASVVLQEMTSTADEDAQDAFEEFFNNNEQPIQ